MKTTTRRYSDNDKHFGPFTFSTASGNWRPIGIVLDSGDDDDYPGCNIRLQGFGRTLICELPNLIKPHRVKHFAQSWDAATVERMGRDWYYTTHKREFGFTVSDGFLQVFLGPQTMDSTTQKSWSKTLPWTDWRFVRHSLYDNAGNHFWTEGRRERWEVQRAVKDICPTVKFEFDDFDGKRIQAITRIEEREWHFGNGSFKWLSLFRKPMIKRSLDIDFSEEVGPEKGSWKGGTIGHSITMLPGELHEAAFRRYCEQEHRSKYRRFTIKFVGTAVGE